MASARASATRCCWPPDSWCGYCWACGPRPTISSSPPPWRAGRSCPSCASAARTHVVERRHVREQAVALEHHAHVATRGRHRRDVLAVDEHRSCGGRSKPATMRRAVVLPQPDGPSSATSSPGASSIDSPSRARVSPNRRTNESKTTVTPCSSTSFLVKGCAVSFSRIM